MVLVPRSRCVQREMRIVGKHCLAARTATRRDSPLVAALRLVGRLERILEQGNALDPLDVVLGELLDRRVESRVRTSVAGCCVCFRCGRLCFLRALALRGCARCRGGQRVGNGCGRIERLCPEQVFEEQCGAVKTDDATGNLVTDQGLGRADVEVERQAERNQLADRDAVEWRPRIDLREFQHPVLGRQRLRSEEVVHAVGIGLQAGLHFRRQCGQ